MEIRIIGEKSEIDVACRKLSEIFPKMTRSSVYPACSGGYRCYINTDTKPIESNQHK